MCGHMFLFLFQIESVHKAGLFRGNKSYQLSHPVDPGEAALVVRLRSIPSKSHALLQPVHFEQHPILNICSLRTITMRPSGPSHEIWMSRESRTLSNSLNTYRYMTVSNTQQPLLLFLLLQLQQQQLLSLPTSVLQRGFSSRIALTRCV